MQPGTLPPVRHQPTGYCGNCGRPRTGPVCLHGGHSAPAAGPPGLVSPRAVSFSAAESVPAAAADPADPVGPVGPVLAAGAGPAGPPTGTDPALTATPQPTRRPGLRIRATAGLAVALLLVASTGIGVKNLLDQRDTAAALEQSIATGDDLARRLDALSAGTSTLTDQIASLRSRIEGQPDPAAVARGAQPSVFTVETDDGTGSAWVVASDRSGSELITNYHVVKDGYRSGSRTVTISRGRATYTGTIERVEQAADLAVVRVRAALPALPVASRRPSVGDPVLVLGSPLGLGGTVTSGIVSAFRTEDGTREMQFSAPISPGNSGGPVINLDGEVIGVSVAKYVADGAEGLGIAIPARTLCAVLQVC